MIKEISVGRLKTVQRGFSTIELLVVLVVVGALGFTGWYVWNAQTASKTQPIPTKATDPYAGWNTYSDANGHYSLRYPKSWVRAAHPELCSAEILLIAPTTASVGRCASESAGEVYVQWAAQDPAMCPDFTSADYTSITKDSVTVSGVRGVKQSGVAKAGNNLGFAGIDAGTVLVQYCFTTRGKTYTANYMQLPSYPDALTEFNTIITKTLRFT